MNSGVFGKKRAFGRPSPIFGKKNSGGKTMFGRKDIGAMARRGQGIARQFGEYASMGSDLAGMGAAVNPALAPVLLPTSAALRGLSMAAKGIGSRSASGAMRTAAKAYTRR
jgi:hypothetical protein